MTHCILCTQVVTHVIIVFLCDVFFDVHVYTNVNNKLFVCFLLQTVQDYMYKTCTCTGLRSGTGVCSKDKTCRMLLPKMETIAQKLREKYDESVHSKLHKSSGHLHQIIVDRDHELKVNSDKMVHFTNSRDYCKANPVFNINGVAGRDCTLNENNTSSSNHCNNLCCDHGYETYTKREAKLCNCKFVWCCKVECDTCHEKITKHRCR